MLFTQTSTHTHIQTIAHYIVAREVLRSQGAYRTDSSGCGCRLTNYCPSYPALDTAHNVLPKQKMATQQQRIAEEMIASAVTNRSASAFDPTAREEKRKRRDRKKGYSKNSPIVPKR